MSRRLYSCPDPRSEISSTCSYRFMYSQCNDSDNIHHLKYCSHFQTKRKPIILKRARGSWPVSSLNKVEKNVRDTCRGSAGTAEGLNGRRDSFLYRSDSLKSRFYTRAASMKSSVSYIDQKLNESDEVMITPYAQILLTLRFVKYRLVEIFSKYEDTSNKSFNDKVNEEEDTPENEPSTTETLSHLEWCLSQLENVQTHRSVSDLATNKFKRLLSRELILRNSKKSNKNICDYICQTFLDEAFISEEDKRDDFLFIPIEDVDEDTMSPKFDLGNSSVKMLQIPETYFNSWGPDIFQIESQFQGSILRSLTMSILESRKLFTTLKVDSNIMYNYLVMVENNYRPSNSYHNSLHAADVVQSVHVIISMAAFKNVFSDLEIFSALMSAAIHDLDHPGVTNQFLINTNNHLAILYNDISVLENHHLATGFSLMRKDGCNIFSSFSRSQQQSIRRMMIDMVLSTDMSKHMTMLADLKTMVETKKVSGSGILNLENYNDRIQILQNLIHCADLSNPTKSISLYKEWTKRVMEEFFSQGDKEKELNVEISPMCDRDMASVPRSQVSFIDFVVYPLWETWAELVQPDADLMLDNLLQNRHYYLSLSEEPDFYNEEDKEE